MTSTLGINIAIKLAGIILVALAATSCSGKPYAVTSALASSDTIRSHPIFIVRHGWHTGLVIPASYLNQTIPELKERFGDAAYYEIGWGDKEFYQAQEITTGLTLQAALWSEGAVMHIVAVPDSPSRYFGSSEVVSTCLTNEQVSSLSTFVGNSFARDYQGRIIRLKRGIYGNSQFYEGEGRFNMLNTCNNWSAKGLQSAGMDISSSFTLTSERVMSAIRELRHQCTLTPNHAVKGALRDKEASRPSP